MLKRALKGCLFENGHGLTSPHAASGTRHFSRPRLTHGFLRGHLVASALPRPPGTMIFVDDDGTGQAKWAFKRNIWVQGREDQMITDAFDRRTIARMEVALERACLLLPADSEKHSARRIIASKIIECANRGDVTLSRLTEAGYAASMQLSASAQSVRKKAVAS